MPDSAPKSPVKALAGWRRVDRKIMRFSSLIGAVGVLLTASAYLCSQYPYLLHWRNVNLDALSRIHCEGSACDSSAYSTDPESEEPDYVVATETRYFIDIATGTTREGRFPPMEYSDTDFFTHFRHPASYKTLDGEVWRLYSLALRVGGNRSFEVMVGCIVKAPSKPIEIPESLMGDLDAALERDADRIARGLLVPRTGLRPSRNSLSVDGFQVVDPETKQIVEQGPWVPVFPPKGVSLPAPGVQFYVSEGALYAAETETNGSVLATSFIEIGFWWVVWSCAAGLFLGAITWFLSRRFLRNYFAVTGMKTPSIEEAQRGGEGQSVEFKRGLSEDENRMGSVEDELLKSVAAFANTNDGVIFVGIDDAGHIKGLRLDFTQKDRMEQKVRQLIRSRIRPTPPVQITFEEVRGFVIAKIAVARGDAPPYMIGGVIYVRDGSSDVQAQPEDVVRLVWQSAY